MPRGPPRKNSVLDLGRLKRLQKPPQGHDRFQAFPRILRSLHLRTSQFAHASIIVDDEVYVNL